MVLIELTLTSIEFSNKLKEFEYNFSFSWVKKVFYQWSFINKVIERRSILKFRYSNVVYYFEYCFAIYNYLLNFPMDKLKYLDEYHFVFKQMYRNKGWNLKTTLNITLLTSLQHNNPLTFTYRYNTNNQFTFLETIYSFINDKFLVSGDVLICDNAFIHTGLNIYENLMYLLFSNNIYIVFLPAYSPELNLCELVFSFVKQFIRTNRFNNESLINSIYRVCSKINHNMMINFYKKCIFKKDFL
ncbi:hypothetical protein ABK040_003804 [Willaertia magna]